MNAIWRFPPNSVLIVSEDMVYQSVFDPLGNLLYSGVKDMITSSWTNIVREVLEQFELDDEEGAFVYRDNVCAVVCPNKHAADGLEFIQMFDEDAWVIAKAYKSLHQLVVTAFTGSRELASIWVDRPQTVNVFDPSSSKYKSPSTWTFRI